MSGRRSDGLPRMHGDIPCMDLAREHQATSSPYARGCSPNLIDWPKRQDIFSVCTGMFLAVVVVTTSGSRLLRMHGDSPSFWAVSLTRATRFAARIPGTCTDRTIGSAQRSSRLSVNPLFVLPERPLATSPDYWVKPVRPPPGRRQEWTRMGLVDGGVVG